MLVSRRSLPIPLGGPASLWLSRTLTSVMLWMSDKSLIFALVSMWFYAYSLSLHVKILSNDPDDCFRCFQELLLQGSRLYGCKRSSQSLCLISSSVTGAVSFRHLALWWRGLKLFKRLSLRPFLKLKVWWLSTVSLYFRIWFLSVTSINALGNLMYVQWM